MSPRHKARRKKFFFRQPEPLVPFVRGKEWSYFYEYPLKNNGIHHCACCVHSHWHHHDGNQFHRSVQNHPGHMRHPHQDKHREYDASFRGRNSDRFRRYHHYSDRDLREQQESHREQQEIHPSWLQQKDYDVFPRTLGYKEEFTGSLEWDVKDFHKVLNVRAFRPDELTIRLLFPHDGPVLLIKGYHGERRDGYSFVSRSFTRKYRLPKHIDPENIVGTVDEKRGYLTIRAISPNLHISGNGAQREDEYTPVIPMRQTYGDDTNHTWRHHNSNTVRHQDEFPRRDYDQWQPHEPNQMKHLEARETTKASTTAESLPSNPTCEGERTHHFHKTPHVQGFPSEPEITVVPSDGGFQKKWQDPHGFCQGELTGKYSSAECMEPESVVTTIDESTGQLTIQVFAKHPHHCSIEPDGARPWRKIPIAFSPECRCCTNQQARFYGQKTPPKYVKFETSARNSCRHAWEEKETHLKDTIRNTHKNGSTYQFKNE